MTASVLRSMMRADEENDERVAPVLTRDAFRRIDRLHLESLADLGPARLEPMLLQDLGDHRRDAP